MTTLEIVQTTEFEELIISQQVTTVEVLPYDMLWAVSKTTLKAIVSASTDFSDFKTRIAAL
mgnify:CR=1 FL=1|jgi:hypothetical protein